MRDISLGLFIILVFGVVSFFLTKFLIFILETIKQKNFLDGYITVKKLIESFYGPLYFLIFGLISVILIDVYNLFLEVNNLDNIVFVYFTIVLTVLIARVGGILLNKALRVYHHLKKVPHLVNGLVLIVVYTFGFFVILQYFEIEITPFIATLGIGGLAIGLALQSTLGNFFAGLNVMSDGSLNVGDYIEIEETTGWIEDMGSIYTKIRTLQNKLIILPNSKLATSIIINDSKPVQEVTFWIPCGVSYKEDLEKVEKVTIEVAKEVQKKVLGAVKEFDPFIRFTEFGDSNINFNIIIKVETAIDKFRVRHELIKRLKKRYDKEKIEISWPVRKIVKG